MKVSLHDCLACSGCVTSAETILLQHQSIDEFRSRLDDPEFTVVVSLSPQSIVSLAAYYGFEPTEFGGKLIALLKSRGVTAVFDISRSREISLIETAIEFVHRYKRKILGENGSDGGLTEQTCLPMLTSACPGWICYAEKTHGSFVLPYISTAKSPQAVIGTLLKRFLKEKSVSGNTRKLYHCSVMPCYDKKLEASRDDFLEAETGIPDTDCVLATTELQVWIESLHINLHDVQLQPFDQLLDDQALSPYGLKSLGLYGGSGGYLDYVARVAARDILGMDLPNTPLPMKQGRNADFRYLVLEREGYPSLKFAYAYGFRNIQGLMRKIKLNKCEYDFVEIMACPGGCLNGGGQMKPTKGQSAHDLIEQLENMYHSESFLTLTPPDQNDAIHSFYRDHVPGGPNSSPAKQLLHTKYHERKKSLQTTVSDW